MKNLKKLSVAVFGIGSVLVMGSASSAFAFARPPAGSAPVLSEVPGVLSDSQKLTVLQLTSIFENGTTKFQYSYIEDIGDGAGLTCGIIGFTGAQLLTVTRSYSNAKNSSSGFEQYFPCLEKMGASIEKDYSCLFPSVSKEEINTQAFKQEGGGVSRSDFGKLWVAAGRDPIMQKVQMDQLTTDAYAPAMQSAQDLGISSALGLAILYDANVQMPQDQLDKMVSFAQQSFSPSHQGRLNPANRSEESEWLGFYQQKRKEYLPGFDRVDALDGILQSGNLDLNLPFQIRSNGKTFKLDGSTN